MDNTHRKGYIVMRGKGKSSIREVLKERDETLWGKLEEVWSKAEPLFEAIEGAGDEKDKTAGKAHSLAVEENLSALISDDRKHTLQPIELFSISSAACLHDMDKSLKVLKKHHGEIAAGEVGLHFYDYGLDPGQAGIVRWIIRVHDHGSFDMDLPADPLVIGTAEVDIKPLAAIFKLADILHADYRRSNDPHPTEAKKRARICIHGWTYDADGKIRFHAVPEKFSDPDHILRAIAMMRKAIEPMAPVLREAGYPYEFTRTAIDESKLIYLAQEKRRTGRSFIGMDSFEEDDQHLFKGRRRESGELYQLLLARDPIVALVGNSGVGKTSLIRAGLFPILRKTGNWKFVYTRPLNDPASDVIQEIWLKIMESDAPDDTDLIKTFEQISDENRSTTLLVVMDQFEDVFRFPDAPKPIAEALYPVQAMRFRNLRVLLSYRADAEGQVGPMLQDIARSFRSLPTEYLVALDREGAKEALDAGFGAAQIGLDPDIGPEAFMKEILDDVDAQGRGFYPPYIQMMGETLKDNVEESIVMKSKYDSLGGAGGIIGNYLFNQLKSFGDKQKDVERILVELISISGPEGRKARIRSIEDLERDLRISRADLTSLLHQMSRRWMIRRLGGGQYEIIHDHLAKLVDENLITKEKDRDLKQFREHLAATAATYASTGLLLEPVVMLRLYQYREQINPSTPEKEILLRSCLAGRGPAWYWLTGSSKAECIPVLCSAMSRSDSRLSAVRALGHMGSRELIPKLLEMAMYEYWEIRKVAADAIVCSATVENIQDLIYMLERGDKYVRTVAAEALVQLDARVAVPKLKKMSETPLLGIQILALEVLARLGIQEVIPRLIHMLEDTNWAKRKAAAEILARLGIRDAIPKLMDMNKDRSMYVRVAVAEALAKLGVRMDFIHLMSVIRQESRSSAVARTAAEALARVATRADIPELKRMFEHESNYGIQGSAGEALARAAAEALARVATRADIPELKRMFGHESDYGIQGSAGEALARLATKKDAEELVDMLLHKNKRVRMAAGKALVRLKAQRVIPELLTMLRISESHVRKASAEILVSLGSEEEISRLLDIIISEGNGASETRDALMGIDCKLYCPPRLI